MDLTGIWTGLPPSTWPTSARTTSRCKKKERMEAEKDRLEREERRRKMREANRRAGGVRRKQ